MDWGYGVDALVVVEVGEFDDEEELFDFDLILLAVEVDDLAVEGMGDADGCATSGEDVVEEGDVECVALRLACGNIGEAVENVVGTVFLHNGHVVKVALAVGEFAFLTDRYDVLNPL